MTAYFCTLFDSNYLSRGYTMIRSLEKESSVPFRVFVFAFDEECYQALRKLNHPSVTVISLQEFEDDELLRVKPQRTVAEYCWTCTSSVIHYSIKHFGLDHCTYLDADLYFFSDPTPTLLTLCGSSIGITPHGFSEKNQYLLPQGIFNVQFTFFRNDQHGINALEWWRARCLEWCYHRIEDGKFGDQLYLNDWPARFSGVMVLEDFALGCAPWNIDRFEFKSDTNRGPLIKEGNDTRSLVFFHFHSLKISQKGLAVLPYYPVNSVAADLVFQPYLMAHAESCRVLGFWPQRMVGGCEGFPLSFWAAVLGWLMNKSPTVFPWGTEPRTRFIKFFSRLLWKRR